MRREIRVVSVVALLAASVVLSASAVPPPAPWTVKDIGKVNAPSSVDVDARGLWNFRADSNDIFGKADVLVFAYQPLSGDGSVAATILGQTGGSDWAKTGIHIRESDAVDVLNMDIHMTKTHGLEFQYRPGLKKDTISRGGDGTYGARVFPTSLRLQREGDLFTPFISYDGGIGWSQVHRPVLQAGFAKDAIAGVSASSNTGTKAGNPVTAVFASPVVTAGLNSPIVQVITGNAGVLLLWPPVANAAGYVVRRSAAADPSFNSIALTPAPIKETTFADTSVANDKQVRYLVSAVFDQGGVMVEGYATAVTATPTALPLNMAFGDINIERPLLKGSTSFDAATGVITISGSGSDIWETADRCHFAGIPIKGNAQITVKILTRPGKTNDWSKAGVMVRESIEGPSRMALLAGTQKNGVAFQWRDKTAGAAAWPNVAAIANAAFKEPIYLRLVRKGNDVTAYTSADGTNFRLSNAPKTFDPPLAETLYFGLAITSHNDGAVTSATFSDLTVFLDP